MTTRPQTTLFEDRTGVIETAAWICRGYHFAASHRLVNPKFTEAENRSFYGKCTNPNGHGHNFFLEVSVEGSIDPVTGRAYPPEKLDEVVEREVVDRLDHKNFNFDIPELSGIVTTGENVLRMIWNILDRSLPSHTLKRLRFNMSPSNSFEYYGED